MVTRECTITIAESTITHTIAERTFSDRRLGVSFRSRKVKDRSDPQPIPPFLTVKLSTEAPLGFRARSVILGLPSVQSFLILQGFLHKSFRDLQGGTERYTDQLRYACQFWHKHLPGLHAAPPRTLEIISTLQWFSLTPSERSERAEARLVEPEPARSGSSRFDQDILDGGEICLVDSSGNYCVILG